MFRSLSEGERPTAVLRRPISAALAFVALLSLSTTAPRAAAPDAPAADRFSRRAEEQLIAEGQAAAQRRVAALVERLTARPEGPEARDLQESIAAIKREAWLHLLQTRLSFALARGDVGTAGAAERMIGLLTAPPTAAPVAPQTRDKREVPDDPKGGQR